MGKLTFQAALGGTVDLVGPNTASTVTLNLPATSGDIVGTGSTGVITTGMISGQVAVAQGGTGSATAQTAINTLAGAVTSGSYLRGNGTNVLMSTIQGADVPTLNQNTTGTAAGLSSILAVASGGTGTSTPALVAGTNVTITGTWPNQTINSSGGSGMVYPGAGIPNSTGSAWGTSYSVTGTGAVVLDTRPTINSPRMDSINGTTNSANAAVLGLNNIVTGTGLSSALQITNNAYNSNNPVILKIINTNGIVSQNLELSGANTGKVAINNGGDATVQLILNSAGANATSTTITASQTASRVLTLPDATDTLVGKATTDTLTNKTISGSSNTITNVSLTSGVTGTLPVANGGTGVTTSTGTGSVVLSTSPTLVTPLLGTPTSGNFSTGTFTWPTFNQNTTGTAAGLSATLAVASGGTGVTTSTGTGSVVLSTSPTLVTPLLGTPTSGNFNTGTFTWPTFNQNTTGTAAGLSATLAIASGGTNTTATPTAGTVVYGTGTAQAYTAAGTTGQVLTSNGSSAPTWSTVAGLGTVTSVAATVPAFLSISGSPITTSGTLAISYSGTALPVANGGTGTTTGSLVNCTVDGTNAVGYLNVPQNAQTGAYTLVLADGGKHIYHASGSAAATYTIPAASSVAFPIGTIISFINLATAAVTISITTDTMYLASTGTTGSRTLAQYGIATATKVSGLSATGIWVISGAGLT